MLAGPDRAAVVSIGGIERMLRGEGAQAPGGEHVRLAEALGRLPASVLGQRAGPEQPAELGAGSCHPLAVGRDGDGLRVERLADRLCVAYDKNQRVYFRKKHFLI
jgi:hypothetical protein